MPTENRSRNTDPRDVFIRLNPLGLGEAELRKDSTGFEDQRTHSDYLLFLAGYRETHPEPQHHADPGEVEQLREDLAKYIARANDFASKMQGARSQVGVLEGELAECAVMSAIVIEREWAEHVGTGDVSSKVEAAFTQLHNDLHKAGEKLAERDALLRSIVSDWEGPGHFPIHESIRRIRTALSASADPSAPGVLPRAHDVNMFQRTAQPGAK